MRILRHTALLVTVALAGVDAAAQIVYTNDFESGATSGWATSISNPPYQRPIAIGTTPSGRRYLGPFGNQQVTLDLAPLPAHAEIIVELDLFVVRSWDGSSTSADGPDVFTAVDRGPPSTLLRTTFTNLPGLTQAYPGTYPGGVYSTQTGAAAINALGFDREGDAVYRLSIRFPHTAPALALELAAALRDRFPTVENESWGIDNMRVTAFLRPPSSATVAVLDTRGSIGTVVDVPIKLRDRVGFAGTTATAVRGVLRFDASMLLPTAQTPAGRVEGRQRLIPLELPIQARSDSLLGTVPFLVLLGDDTTTAITFDSAVAVGDSVALTSVPGRFTATGCCGEGGRRLIDPWPALTLRPVRPNPTLDLARLWLRTTTAMTVHARLDDAQGRRRWEHTARFAAGDHELTIDTRELGSGVYRIVVEVDGERHEQRLVVVR